MRIILLREGASDGDSDILRWGGNVKEVAKTIKKLVLGKVGLITSSNDYIRSNVVDATGIKVSEIIGCEDLGRIDGLGRADKSSYAILKRMLRNYPHLQTIIFIGTLKAEIKEVATAYAKINGGLVPGNTNLNSPLGYELLDIDDIDDGKLKELDKLIAQEIQRQEELEREADDLEL